MGIPDIIQYDQGREFMFTSSVSCIILFLHSNEIFMNDNIITYLILILPMLLMDNSGISSEIRSRKS